MKFTRRTGLKLAGMATIVGVAGLAIPAQRRYAATATTIFGDQLLGTLRYAPTATLSDERARVLCAAAEAVAGMPVESSHYDRFFRWRAEHLPGYAQLYAELAAALLGKDAAFCDRDLARREELVRLVVPGAEPERFAYRARMVWSRRAETAFFFQKYFVAEVVLLFYATDAWVALGYDGWPGVASGLEKYKSLPHGAVGTATGR